MSEIEDEIKKMGFDAETAHNLAEIVRTTRNAALEECAKIADDMAGDPNDPNWQWHQACLCVAERIRGAVSTPGEPNV